MEIKSKPQLLQNASSLDVTVEQLVEAIHDPKKAEELLQAKGWNKEDLIAQAELLTKELAAGISSVNIV